MRSIKTYSSQGRLVFITQPVADLPTSMAFYKALGFDHNPDFTDDTASCIVIDELTHVMRCC